MAITRQQIIEAIHDGARLANERYEAWTGGAWITDSGVEQMMVACIAETIHNSYHAPEKKDQREGWLAMEIPFSGIKEWSQAKARQGRNPKILKDRHRADLVLFNKRNLPICVIEMKRQWSRRACLKDLDRLHVLVSRLSHRDGGSLRRGFLATTVVRQDKGRVSAEERISDQVAKIRVAVQQHFEGREINWAFHPGPTVPYSFGGWAWASLCVEVSARRRA